MKKVLFVGDINTDVIMGGLKSQPVPDKEITCQSFDVCVGSTAVICASAYSFLGGKAAFAGLAGKDQNGDFMVGQMKKFGINTKLIERTDKVPTGVTVNLVFKNIRSQVTYPGTIAAYAGAKLTNKVIKRFRHVHFAGPYQQTKFISRITGLLRTASAAGVTTSLDPQWDASEKWAHMREWLPLLTYLFVNADETLSITKCKSLEKACRELVRLTACPIVKAGKDGAILCRSGKLVSAPTIDVKVKDPTGAGDNFDAAFLYGVIEKGMNTLEAVNFANAAGARSCMFIGGVEARSTYNDVIRFMKGHME